MRTLIIAEAGVNHNGDINLAKELISKAADAGADLVKFQTFNTSKCISRDAPKAQYQKEATDQEQSQFDMVRKLELSKTDHHVLIDACNRCGIGFFSTAFDHESFNLLMELNIDRVKIPSGEITNLPLLRHVSGRGLPLILSTGMSTLGDIEAALNVIENAGTPRSLITILHCNTEYPTPMSDVNLRAMNSLREAFGVAVGYSDHTQGIEVPVAAVALGATVIEKHFTLDRNLPGPDHKASLEPDELTEMVRSIRNIEMAMGTSIKRPSESELKNIQIARKSIVAASDIQTGEKFSEENIMAKRPGTGISPMKWDDVIGRTATRDFVADELITL